MDTCEQAEHATKAWKYQSYLLEDRNSSILLLDKSIHHGDTSQRKEHSEETMGRREGWIYCPVLIKDRTDVEAEMVKEDIKHQQQHREVNERTKRTINLEIALSTKELHEAYPTKECRKSKGNQQEKVGERIKDLVGTTELEEELVEGR